MANSYKCGYDITQDGDNYRGANSSFTGASQFWVLDRWLVEPGDYTITEGGVRHVLTEDVDTSGKWAIVQRDPATNIITVLASEDITVNSTTSTVAASYSLNMDVTVPDNGLEFYACWWSHRQSDVLVGRPGVRNVRTATAATDPNHTRTYVLDDATFGADFITSFDADDSGVYLSSVAASTLHMTYTTSNGKLQTLGTSYSGTTLGVVPVQPVDGRAFYLFRDVVVANGNTLTVDFRNNTSSLGTFVVDMGVTDQMTFLANSVALPTVGGTAQAGDTFDIAIGLEPNNGGADVYWVNKSRGAGGLGLGVGDNLRDITTISHETARSAARGNVATVNAPNLISISGTATIASITTVNAADLLVMLGDSQTATKSSDAAATSFHRLGSALDPLHDGELWHAAISGNRFDSDTGTTSTAAKTRYSGTVGTHDLIEMVKKSGATLVVSGIGINDISAGVSDDSTAISVPAALQTSLDAILADIGNGSAALFGLPPYSDGNADTYESDAVKNWNAELLESAQAYSVGYANPWPSTWDGTKNGNDAYVFAAAYTGDGGLHYNDTGAELVALLLVRAANGEIVQNVRSTLTDGLMSGVIGKPLRGRM